MPGFQDVVFNLLENLHVAFNTEYSISCRNAITERKFQSQETRHPIPSLIQIYFVVLLKSFSAESPHLLISLLKLITPTFLQQSFFANPAILHSAEFFSFCYLIFFSSYAFIYIYFFFTFVSHLMFHSLMNFKLHSSAATILHSCATSILHSYTASAHIFLDFLFYSIILTKEKAKRKTFCVARILKKIEQIICWNYIYRKKKKLKQTTLVQ